MQLRHKFATRLNHPGSQNHCYTLSEIRFAVCIHAIFHAVCQNARKSSWRAFLSSQMRSPLNFCLSCVEMINFNFAWSTMLVRRARRGVFRIAAEWTVMTPATCEQEIISLHMAASESDAREKWKRCCVCLCGRLLRAHIQITGYREEKAARRALQSGGEVRPGVLRNAANQLSRLHSIAPGSACVCLSFLARLMLTKRAHTGAPQYHNKKLLLPERGRRE